MATSSKASSHPGTFVRETVIPGGMSVKDAAKRLGIGRPALSNFLNGKSALSPEMALRLEKAFGADGSNCSICRPPTIGRSDALVKRMSRSPPSFRLF